MIPCFRVLPVNSGFGYGTGPDIADCEAWQCLKEYRTGNCHSDAKLSSELVTTKMSLSFLLFHLFQALPNVISFHLLLPQRT